MLLHRAALPGRPLQPGSSMADGRRDALCVLFQGRAGVHAQEQQAPGDHSLPRLADGIGAGTALRDLQAPGHGHPRVCYTLHNFRHQGITGERSVGHWPDRHSTSTTMIGCTTIHRAALNLMKGGIVYSNFVTTVSPHYAWEARTPTRVLAWPYTARPSRQAWRHP